MTMRERHVRQGKWGKKKLVEGYLVRAAQRSDVFSHILIFTGRIWCHCRMVYLPMSYLYGKRFVGPITSTVLPDVVSLSDGVSAYLLQQWDSSKLIRLHD